MSGSYCNEKSRELILQVIAWSFKALGILSANKIFFAKCNVLFNQKTVGFVTCLIQKFNGALKVMAYTPLETHGAYRLPKSMSAKDGLLRGNE